MDTILQAIARKEARIAVLKQQIEALHEVRRYRVNAERAPRSSVTNALLEILRENTPEWKSAKEICDIARNGGMHFNDRTVASILSRLARNGRLLYADKKYRSPH